MESETPEERKKRLNRERQRRWRAQQDQATLNRLRREATERKFCRLLTENVEQTKRRRLSDARSHARRRMKETEEEAKARRLADLQSHARRRLRETEEEAQARRLANAQSQARRRKRKTEEQTQGRRDDDTDCNALQRRIENFHNQLRRKDKHCRRNTLSKYVTALKRIAVMHLEKFMKTLPGSSLTSDESVPSEKCEKSVSEIINDLSLIVQNLVAGIGTVSTNVLSDGCMQLKIHFPEKSPQVLLQFPLDSNFISKLVWKKRLLDSDEEEENSEKDRSVYGSVNSEKMKNRVCEDVTKNSSTTFAVVKPLLNYNEIDETENNEKLVKGFENKLYYRCTKVCDDVKANLLTLTPVIKQEKPELLAVLSDSDQNDDEHLPKNQIKVDCPQTNVSSELKRNCQFKSNTKVSVPVETEYIEVTPDLDTFLFTNKISRME